MAETEPCPFFLWPDADQGPGRLTFEFEKVGNREEWAAMHISWDPRRKGGSRFRDGEGPEIQPLTASLLREIPFGELVNHARLELPNVVALRQALTTWGKKALKALEAPRAKGPGRPPLYDGAHFRGVARIYAAAWQIGGNPTQAVAEAWGNTKSAAAKWVARCRQLGLLPATKPGSARGSGPDLEEPSQPDRHAGGL